MIELTFWMFMAALGLYGAVLVTRLVREAKLRDAKESSGRAVAFAAGYRCGQEAALKRIGSPGVPLVDWEREEAANAVEHGFMSASEFCQK